MYMWRYIHTYMGSKCMYLKSVECNGTLERYTMRDFLEQERSVWLPSLSHSLTLTLSRSRSRRLAGHFSFRKSLHMRRLLIAVEPLGASASVNTLMGSTMLRLVISCVPLGFGTGTTIETRTLLICGVRFHVKYFSKYLNSSQSSFC